MSAAAIALAFSAAVLHATWNAFLRSGADRLWAVTVMSLSGVVVAVPLVALLPLPPPEAWAYIALSSALQVGYSLFLVAAYRNGELGQIYPLVRGTVPLLVTLGGVAFAGERIGIPDTVGVGLVALGIMSLALGKGRAAPSSIGFALATSVIIAAYSTVDAMGVRTAGHSGAYAAWVLFVYGLLLLGTYTAIRGRLALALGSKETRKALGGGVLALVAYAAVIAAYAYGPAGPVTAIRETSVVFAAVIGRLFLGETLTARRIAACCVVALGAICIGWGR